MHTTQMPHAVRCTCILVLMLAEHMIAVTQCGLESNIALSSGAPIVSLRTNLQPRTSHGWDFGSILCIFTCKILQGLSGRELWPAPPIFAFYVFQSKQTNYYSIIQPRHQSFYPVCTFQQFFYGQLSCSRVVVSGSYPTLWPWKAQWLPEFIPSDTRNSFSTFPFCLPMLDLLSLWSTLTRIDGLIKSDNLPDWELATVSLLCRIQPHSIHFCKKQSQQQIFPWLSFGEPPD